MHFSTSSVTICTKLATILLTALLAAGIPMNSLAQSSPPVTKKPLVAIKKVKVAEVSIQGQVFVVTKGGNNIKLALVGVSDRKSVV